MLGSDDGIKLGSTYGKVLGTKLGSVYGITLDLDVGTELGSLDGSFDASNDGKLEGLLIVDSLVSTDGKVLVSDMGMNWDLLMVKCSAMYLEIYMESHLGLMLEQV